MAMNRPQFNLQDKSSETAATRGTALAIESSLSAYPESQQIRRDWFLQAQSVGATAQELFCEGLQNFRLRVPESGVTSFKGFINMCSAGGSHVAFYIQGAASNIDGTVALLGTPTVTKYGTPAVALAVTVDSADDTIRFTGTGLAGDSAGKWFGRLEITDVTQDFGTH